MGLMLKLFLFICAYSPLISILLFLNLPDAFPLWLLILIGIVPLGVALILCIFIYSKTKSISGCEPLYIEKIEDKTNEVVAYIIPYVLSIVSLQISGIRGVFVIGILLLMLFAVYANSSMIYINPLMTLVGYRLYKIEYTANRNDTTKCHGLLISRKIIGNSPVISTCELSDGIYLEVK